MRTHMLVCLGLGLVLAGAPAALAAEKKEPVFRGKPLSYWMKALKDKDRAARKDAIQAVAGIGPEAKAAVPALIGILKEKDLLLSSEAGSALRKLGAAALPELRKALKDKDARTRL